MKHSMTFMQFLKVWLKSQDASFILNHMDSAKPLQVVLTFLLIILPASPGSSGTEAFLQNPQEGVCVCDELLTV